MFSLIFSTYFELSILTNDYIYLANFSFVYVTVIFMSLAILRWPKHIFKEFKDGILEGKISALFIFKNIF